MWEEIGEQFGVRNAILAKRSFIEAMHILMEEARKESVKVPTVGRFFSQKIENKNVDRITGGSVKVRFVDKSLESKHINYGKIK